MITRKSEALIKRQKIIELKRDTTQKLSNSQIAERVGVSPKTVTNTWNQYNPPNTPPENNP